HSTLRIPRLVFEELVSTCTYETATGTSAIPTATRRTRRTRRHRDGRDDELTRVGCGRPDVRLEGGGARVDIRCLGLCLSFAQRQLKMRKLYLHASLRARL